MQLQIQIANKEDLNYKLHNSAYKDFWKCNFARPDMMVDMIPNIFTFLDTPSVVEIFNL